MVLLRYLLILIGGALLAGAAGILLWDLYQVVKLRKQPEGETQPPASLYRTIRCQAAKRLAAMALVPPFYGQSTQVAPSWVAGVRTI